MQPGLQYLIRTPVPHGGQGHADDEARPRQIRAHRVSKYVEGVISRDAAGRVGHSDGRDGVGISLHQSVPASNLHKASQTGTIGKLMPEHKMLLVCGDILNLLKPMRMRAPTSMTAV